MGVYVSMENGTVSGEIVHQLTVLIRNKACAVWSVKVNQRIYFRKCIHSMLHGIMLYSYGSTTILDLMKANCTIPRKLQIPTPNAFHHIKDRATLME